MEKKRCQAILLTPQARYWHKYSDKDVRCSFTAKPDSSFCGNHAKLSAYISEIVWKNSE